jgi:hypothetical protein
LQHILHLPQVTFEHNKGPFGALFLSTEATATMTGGKTSFRSNTDSAYGGGASLFAGARLTVLGPLCAQNNGGVSAGFLWAGTGGKVTFNEPETANIAGNFPNDIGLDLGGSVFCGNSTTSWNTQGLYNVTGQVCACNDAFINTTETPLLASCDSCGFGWHADACSCKVRHSL